MLQQNTRLGELPPAARSVALSCVGRRLRPRCVNMPAGLPRPPNIFRRHAMIDAHLCCCCNLCSAVIITLEVVRDSGIPTVVPLDQPRSAGTAGPAEQEASSAATGSAGAAAAGTAQQAEQQPAGSGQAQPGEGQPEVRRSAGVVPGFALACDPGKPLHAAACAVLFLRCVAAGSAADWPGT